ncbi:MAG: pirin family protein, partial [Bacteroidetes bacterium]|nr:pirin family protein [Bacteroidota bacterium]
GVECQPDKEFETVTIAYKGRIRHNDNSGGGGVTGEGDVQWMTGGSGILHKEFHEVTLSKEGGNLQMVQLWVNLSSENKKQKPKYQSITKEQIGKFGLENNAGIIEVIAGEYKGVKGPAYTFSPVELQNAKLNKGGKATFSFPTYYTAAALVIKGSIKVNGEANVPTDHFVLFDTDEETFEIEAVEDSIVLILAGKPLREPIFAHGPFVMNTRNEIIDAIEDFNNGKFGVL